MQCVFKNVGLNLMNIIFSDYLRYKTKTQSYHILQIKCLTITLVIVFCYNVVTCSMSPISVYKCCLYVGYRHIQFLTDRREI